MLTASERATPGAPGGAGRCHRRGAARRLSSAADPATGRWAAKPGGAWTDGFWVGLLWLAHGVTDAPRYRAWGLEWAGRLRGRERQASHDIGFLFQYGAVLGWRTVEPVLRAMALAADRLVAMCLARE